jgi:hypothetical protein
MKKLIVVLFLAIGFVMMTLISYMKFQTVVYFETAPSAGGNQFVDQSMYPEIEALRGDLAFP